MCACELIQDKTSPSLTPLLKLMDGMQVKSAKRGDCIFSEDATLFCLLRAGLKALDKSQYKATQKTNKLAKRRREDASESDSSEEDSEPRPKRRGALVSSMEAESAEVCSFVYVSAGMI